MEGPDLEIIFWKRQSLQMMSNSVVNMLFKVSEDIQQVYFCNEKAEERTREPDPSTLIITPLSLSVYPSIVL